MTVSLSHKTKQFFWLILKIAIVFTCGFFIYWKLAKNESLVFSDFLSFCTKNNLFSAKNILFLSVFSFFNWFFEIKKWQLLVNSYDKINIITATHQCLASLTVSLFTPNRLGEYVAKAMYFKKIDRKKIVAFNAIGNLQQLFATLFFGAFGISFFLFQQNIDIYFSKIGLVAFSFLLFALTMYFLFQKSKTTKNWILKIIQFKNLISRKTHLQTLGLSLLRYLIFSHQFYFLLQIFHVEVDYFTVISAIATMYLVSSFLPMIAFLDVVVKSSVALWVFSFLEVNTTIVLASTTVLWIFNFVIPAILGSGFVLNYKPKLAI
jgi:hypothetical protein